MRATAPYAPQKTPWGEEITFDEVTASIRHTQLRIERYCKEHKHSDKCFHPWFGRPKYAWDEDKGCEFMRSTNEVLNYCDRQIALCAQGFTRHE